MSIRIDRAVREAIVSNPTGFDLQVTGADDPEAAARALAAARAEVAAIDAGPDSAPGLSAGDRNGVKMAALIRVPGEPGLRIDGGYVPEEILVTIPDLVARHLRAEGVTSARIGLPRTHPIEAIDQTPDAIVARIHVMPPQRKDEPAPVLDPAWIEAAVDWVTQGEADVTLMGQRDRDGFDVSPAQMRSIMEEIGARRSVGTCVFARVDSELFAAGLARSGRVHTLNLGVCDPEPTRRANAIDTLRATIERLPSVACAAIDAIDHLGTHMSRSRSLRQPHLNMDAADHFLPEAGFQVLLGKGHLARLDVDVGAQVDRLPDGRCWLEIVSPVPSVLTEAAYESLLDRCEHVLKPLLPPVPQRGPIPISQWLREQGR